MTIESTDLAARLAFAADIARAAGQRLLGLRQSGRFGTPEALGAVGDQAADGYLQGALFGRFAPDGVLSEETKDDRRRLERRAVWIVDPLDGTKEYGTQRHDFAVHVGLAVDGVPMLGAVALPAIGRTLAAAIGPAAGPTVHVHTDAVPGLAGEWPTAPVRGDGARSGPLRLVVSRSHTPEWVQRFAERIGGAELVPCGSVGFKVAMLLFGKADCYVHKTGLKEWDTCAPEVVARACGFAVCRFDGTAQRYNLADPRNDEIVVCRPADRDRVLQTLRAVDPR